MKWIDGLTDYEKQRRRMAKLDKKAEWHRWFAWYPVTVGSVKKHKIKVWLDYVERSGVVLHTKVFYYNYQEMMKHE
jgi:hypothetical protein